MHDAGVDDDLAGPVAALLHVVAVPAIVGYAGPIVGRCGRVFEEDGDFVGIIHLVLDGIIARDDAAHVAVDEQAGLHCAALLDVDITAAGDNGAVGGGGLTAVKGIDDLGSGRGTDSSQLDTEGVLMVAAGNTRPGGLGALAQRQTVIGSAQHEHVRRRNRVDRRTHGCHQRTPRAGGALHMVVVHAAVHHLGGGAGIGYAGQLAGIDHLLDVLLVGLPVLEEDTRGAGHGEHIGVAGFGILVDGVLRVVGITVLRVVVLDEGHRITAVAGLLAQALDAVRQVGPLVVVRRVAHHVAEGEVKGSALHHPVDLGAIDPGLDGAQVAVPVLAHRIGGVSIGVVHTRITGRVALGHVDADAGITQFVDQVDLREGVNVDIVVDVGLAEVVDQVAVFALDVALDAAAVGIVRVELGRFHGQVVAVASVEVEVVIAGAGVDLGDEGEVGLYAAGLGVEIVVRFKVVDQVVLADFDLFAQLIGALIDAVGVQVDEAAVGGVGHADLVRQIE